ncbi:hypothetical protein [Spiroplasma endosymbiont of Polydrusus formosus]|uniref:hypothetical protein n=1 Tax=Spiroplasma endosymbiont of Polydrusus formosus TaxID=3139326 RepID=UPI0035B527EE
MLIDLDKKFQDKERKLYKIKKLLSLLIVLTISGTAVPIIIDANTMPIPTVRKD